MTINTTEKFERFIELCIERGRITNGQCGFMLEFVDTSITDARVLQIKLGDDGTYSVYLATV